jgi:general secretion pathway protein D
VKQFNRLMSPTVTSFSILRLIASAQNLPAAVESSHAMSAGNTNAAYQLLPVGRINFPAADLNQVLSIYEELVGRTILRPATLPAPTITLVTQTPLTRSEAIRALDAVLALNGIAAVNVGEKFVKLVPTAQAGQIGAPFDNNGPDQLSDLGQYVTHVAQTAHVKPSELVQALSPFASPGQANGILPIDSSQILVLRDYSENVKRMLEVLKRIDVVAPPEFLNEVIPIKYALATDIASALNSLSSAGSGNSSGGSGAAATRSSSTLRNSGSNPLANPTAPGASAASPSSSAGSGSFTQRLQNIVTRAATSGEFRVLGETKVLADERSNSLLIFASRADMKRIKDIIEKLDVVLPQVLIEAAIIEVTLTSSTDLGISYLTPQPHGNGYFQGVGAINNNNILSSSSFNLINAATNVAGSLPSGFSYLASLGNDLDVTVTALAANSRARVLQRPRIQTSHAVPATLFVGESHPYPQGSYYGGASFGSYSTIQQLQIGVSLEVTPLINPEGLVVMDIHQKIDSVTGSVTIENVGDVPITSSKEASAEVAVRDHDTVILGGLIETSKNDNNSGVPLLKDIPILGYLFRSSHADETQDELIVLIRPTVLPTPEVAALNAQAEKSKLTGVQQMEKEVQAEEVEQRRAMERDLMIQR